MFEGCNPASPPSSRAHAGVSSGGGWVRRVVDEAKVAAMADGDVVLLENVRFFAEEEKNDQRYSGQSPYPT